MDFNINVAVDYTALQFATAAGLTHPTGRTSWEFDTSSVLPTGLTASFTKLTGTPTVAGTWTIKVKAVDAYYSPIGDPYPVTVAVVDPNAPAPEPEPEPEPEPVPEPVTRSIAQEVAAALDRDGDLDTIKLAETHAPLVTVFVRSYTRGRGFLEGEPNADLRAVIVSATTRWTVNAEQSRQYSAGDYSETGATLTGFSLLERHVLNLYRRRAA